MFLRRNRRIVIGHHSNIPDNSVLRLADDLACIVGNWVTVGHSAIVHACTVGDEVLVGMGAVIWTSRSSANNPSSAPRRS